MAAVASGVVSVEPYACLMGKLYFSLNSISGFFGRAAPPLTIV